MLMVKRSTSAICHALSTKYDKLRLQRYKQISNHCSFGGIFRKMPVNVNSPITQKKPPCGGMTVMY